MSSDIVMYTTPKRKSQVKSKMHPPLDSRRFLDYHSGSDYGEYDPMGFSQKTVYALRVTFELAKREGKGQISIPVLAEAQSIPPRFLENILIILKQAGIVKSVRGKEGGYLLARPAKSISVGDVLRATEGAISPVSCLGGNTQETCPMRDDCVFLPMWSKAQKAMFAIYDTTVFSDLVVQGKKCEENRAAMYSI